MRTVVLLAHLELGAMASVHVCHAQNIQDVFVVRLCLVVSNVKEGLGCIDHNVSVVKDSLSVKVMHHVFLVLKTVKVATISLENVSNAWLVTHKTSQTTHVRLALDRHGVMVHLIVPIAKLPRIALPALIQMEGVSNAFPEMVLTKQEAVVMNAKGTVGVLKGLIHVFQDQRTVNLQTTP